MDDVEPTVEDLDDFGEGYDEFPEEDEEADNEEPLEEDLDIEEEPEEEPEEELQQLELDLTETGQIASKSTVTELDEEDWMSSDFLTRNELARVLLTRAAQIEKDSSQILPKGVKPRSTDPYDLACQEIEQGTCPMKIERKMNTLIGGPSVLETVRVRDLRIIHELPKRD